MGRTCTDHKQHRSAATAALQQNTGEAQAWGWKPGRLLCTRGGASSTRCACEGGELWCEVCLDLTNLHQVTCQSRGHHCPHETALTNEALWSQIDFYFNNRLQPSMCNFCSDICYILLFALSLSTASSFLCFPLVVTMCIGGSWQANYFPTRTKFMCEGQKTDAICFSSRGKSLFHILRDGADSLIELLDWEIMFPLALQPHKCIFTEDVSKNSFSFYCRKIIQLFQIWAFYIDDERRK